MKIKKSHVNNSADANVDSLSILTKYLLYPKKISLVGFKNCVNMLKKTMIRIDLYQFFMKKIFKKYIRM